MALSTEGTALGVGAGARTSCRFQPLLTHKSVSGKQNHKRCKEALKTQPMLLEPAAHAHRYPETNGEHVLWSGEGVVGKGEGGVTCELTEHNQPNM